MNIDAHGQIAAFISLLVRGLSGACRALVLLALVALLLLAPACGIRATFDDLDEDEDGVMLDDDCAPKDGSTGSVPIYDDADGDGHGVPPQIGMGCDGDPGVSVVADDCDDQNNHIWEYSVWYLDNDRDGYGVEPGVELCASEAAGYSQVAGDCLDDDPGAWPGAPTSCDGDDNDCDGQTDEDCEVPGGTLSASDADWLAQGTGDAQLGAAIAPAGDVDCDGLDDALIGAPGADGGMGAVVLAYGSDEALRWTLGEESARLASLTGATEGGGFGAAVAGGVDFNGDGCSDLVIGAPLEGSGGIPGHGLGPDSGWGSSTSGGELFVAMGPWFSPVAEIGAAWGVETLSGKDGGELGRELACGQDVLGDGLSDCLASAPLQTAEVGGKEAGAVFLLSPPGITGDTMEDAASLQIEGTNKAERLGSALALGDLNADGVADLALGASTDWVDRASGNHATQVGRVYVVYDVPTGSYDAEGLADTWVEGVALDGTGLALAAGGDLDGDGYDDLVVGAPLWDEGEGDEGRVLAYSGANVVGSEVPLTDGDAFTTVVGGDASDLLGSSVTLVKDMSGDARAELLAGSPGTDGERGAALLFMDAMGGTVPLTDAWLRVEGSATGDLIGQGTGAVDANGLGRSDLLIGGAAPLGSEADFAGAGLAILVFTDAF